MLAYVAYIGAPCAYEAWHHGVQPVAALIAAAK
jgi:hypothetical protein